VKTIQEGEENNTTGVKKTLPTEPHKSLQAGKENLTTEVKKTIPSGKENFTTEVKKIDKKTLEYTEYKEDTNPIILIDNNRVLPVPATSGSTEQSHSNNTNKSNTDFELDLECVSLQSQASPSVLAPSLHTPMGEVKEVSKESKLPISEVEKITNESSLPINEVNKVSKESSLPKVEVNKVSKELSIPINEVNKVSKESSLPINKVNNVTKELTKPISEFDKVNEESSLPIVSELPQSKVDLEPIQIEPDKRFFEQLKIYNSSIYFLPKNLDMVKNLYMDYAKKYPNKYMKILTFEKVLICLMNATLGMMKIRGINDCLIYYNDIRNNLEDIPQVIEDMSGSMENTIKLLKNSELIE
jgi:hypothetical protein